MSVDIERPQLRSLRKYIPGRSIEEVQREYGLTEVIKLASNENPLGTSPRALAAMQAELTRVSMYPEPTCPDLTNELSRHLGLPQDRILFGNGADGILTMIAQAFVSQDDEAVFAAPTFSIYSQVVQIMGGQCVAVPVDPDLRHDVSSMAAAVTQRTKLLFLCSPNNPTGTIVRRDEAEWLLQRLPERVVVVFDEAYCDFVEAEDYPDSLAYIRQGLNVLSLRTFSKIAGLAGLRIGYALGKAELIESLGKVRESFPVNRVAQVGASAALNDREFKERTLAVNRDGKRFLYAEFGRMGLRYVPTQANFVFVDFAVDSTEAFNRLLRRGVVVRPGFIWDYPTWARISVGTQSDNEKLIAALEAVLGELRG